MRFLILIVLVLSLLSAQKREALLIGNSHYKYINNLKDPSYNLKRLKRTLEDLGFNVKLEYDLNSEKLEDAINNFASRLSKNSNSIGFFYYTGHGYHSYLIPIDVDTKDMIKVKHHALNINEMLEILKMAGNRLNPIFFRCL